MKITIEKLKKYDIVENLKDYYCFDLKLERNGDIFKQLQLLNKSELRDLALDLAFLRIQILDFLEDNE